MFRFPKTVDIITVFSKANCAASKRVVDLATKASLASADETSRVRDAFEVQVTETNPTVDQFRTILQYTGLSGISAIINGATTESDALKKFKSNPDNFQRPVIVDWNSGRAVAGDNESKILKLLNAQN